MVVVKLQLNINLKANKKSKKKSIAKFTLLASYVGFQANELDGRRNVMVNFRWNSRIVFKYFKKKKPKDCVLRSVKEVASLKS